MRNLMTVVVFAAAVTFGSVAGASAAAPTTGNPDVDAVLLQYYNAVGSACSPSGSVAPAVKACETALKTFTALATPKAILALPEIKTLIASGKLSSAAVTAAIDHSPTFQSTFIVAAADLGKEINRNSDRAFLAAIKTVVQETLGFDTAGGPSESSPTLPG